MKNIFSLLVIIIAFISFSFAQPPGGMPRQAQTKGSISGKILDEGTKAPVEYAAVALLNPKDSAVVAGTITDQKGNFTLDVKNYGSYILKIEFIGYHPEFTDPVTVSEENSNVYLGKISMKISSQNLETVEVAAERSQMQLGLDKKIFNVEKDLTVTGASAVEVLQNIPSVTVDMDGNINLRGSGNVKILVNGKPSSLTGIGPSSILEQIPANAIESVEVITNPSAKYQAEGMAGIINIILKKEKKKGLNGMVSGTIGSQNHYNGSINLNYGVGKFNFFGSYDIRYSGREGYGLGERETFLNDTIYLLDQDSKWDREGVNHTLKGGFDLNFKNDFFTVMGMYNTGPRFSETDIIYRNYLFDYNNPVYFFSRFNSELEEEWGQDVNVSYRHTFPQKGHQLTADFMYGTGSETEDADIFQRTLNFDEQPIGSSPFLQHTLNEEEQETYFFRTDYAYPIGDNGKLEAGIRTDMRTIITDYNLEDFSYATGEWVNNELIGNSFIYDENIHAAYGSFGNKVNKFSYQVGVRAEWTNTIATLSETNESHSNDYISFFPTIHFGREIGENTQLQLSYSRRINRPSFWSLNPFFTYADALTIRRGNPALDPEMINSVELNYLKYFKNGTLSSSVYYRYSTDIKQRVRRLQNDSIILFTWENLPYGHSYGAELVGSYKITKWWRMNGSLNLFRSINEGGELGDQFDADFFSWSSRFSSNWTLPKEIELQFTGFYRGPMESNQGKIKPMFFSDLGMKKNVLNNRGSVSVRVSDLFNTMKFQLETFGEGVTQSNVWKGHRRSVYLSLSYKIGQNYKQRDRRRDGNMDMDDMGF